MTDTIPYEVTGRLGEVEFRRYPAIILATVRGLGENEAFMLLFRYISGNNRQGKKVPMTAPVITPEKIAMTAPVISGAAGMSFVMPPSYTRDAVPEPGDTRVSLGEVPPREVAVIRFRGRASLAEVAEIRDRLLGALEENGIPIAGEPFLMRYNAPFTPGFLRRNEVGVEIRR
jgi:effector-binding domain-containing protein